MPIPRSVAAACLLLLASCSTAPVASTPREAVQGSTVLVLVRHAEKAAEPEDDPPLTLEGQQRAQALVGVALEAGVSAIYSTQLARTRQTVEPLARQLGLEVTVRPLAPGQTEAHTQALAAELLARERGRTVLVVGHSNTLPQLARALSGKPVPEMADAEYDRLMVVVVPPSGPAQLLVSRFGAPASP